MMHFYVTVVQCYIANGWSFEDRGLKINIFVDNIQMICINDKQIKNQDKSYTDIFNRYLGSMNIYFIWGTLENHHNSKKLQYLKII